MPDDLQDVEDEFFKRMEEDRERFEQLTPEEQKAEAERRRKAAGLAAVISAI